VLRLAVLSLHTSPLAQPGTGDGGGMNVYVRELGSALARAGLTCEVYTRAWSADLAPTATIEEGVRVHHVAAGPARPVPPEGLRALVEPFTDGVLRHLRASGAPDLVHANYWLSGVAGHAVKHELEVPLISTFHTLARVKAAPSEDPGEVRARAEAEVVACSDAILASSVEEASQLVSLYDADPDRIEVVTPGVDHDRFSPGSAQAARRSLELGPAPVVLFVGRIQPLKGLDLAVQALAELPDGTGSRARPPVLVVVGGPSGPEGPAELARARRRVAALGLDGRVRFLPPVPHAELADYYRAADVCVVPSRSESFGLVALEAAACGTPVVAADVGGLRTIVADGETGLLVEDRHPRSYAAALATVLGDADLARSMGLAAARRARRFSWSITAARLRRLYGDLAVQAPVECS